MIDRLAEENSNDDEDFAVRFQEQFFPLYTKHLIIHLREGEFIRMEKLCSLSISSSCPLININ